MTLTKQPSLCRAIYFLALGLSLLPGRALAQTDSSFMEGKFSLPSEVRWVNADLPAGSYSFSVDPKGAFSVIRVSKDKRVVAAFIGLAHKTDITTQTDSITVVHDAGGAVVRALDLPEFGVGFDFSIPKSTPLAAIAPTP